MLCDNPEVRHAASNQDNQSDAAFHGEVAVVVTGSTDAPTLARLAASGRPWLIKPVDLAVLHQALSRLVEPAVAE